MQKNSIYSSYSKMNFAPQSWKINVFQKKKTENSWCKQIKINQNEDSFDILQLQINYIVNKLFFNHFGNYQPCFSWTSRLMCFFVKLKVNVCSQKELLF